MRGLLWCGEEEKIAGVEGRVYKDWQEDETETNKLINIKSKITGVRKVNWGALVGEGDVLGDWWVKER